MKKRGNILREQGKRIKTRILTIALCSVLLYSCSKDVSGNKDTVSTVQLHVSESKLVLLQGNASNTAMRLDWKASQCSNAQFTVEAAVGGSSFKEPLAMFSTDQSETYFNVKDFNNYMSVLLYANNTGMVEFRIKEEWPGSKKTPVYSEVVAVQVTTYQNFVEYEGQDVFKIPGNYQGWNLATAPKIVSAGNTGEYEGYINFTNAYPQMLLVKGSQWDPKTTYTYIGADKFGFGGSMLSVFGGTGAYLFRANTNTNKWSYTKINEWILSGSAASGAGVVMNTGDEPLSWNITANFSKGDFRFKANNADAVTLGHKADDETGVPSYDGGNIVIKEAGNYTIKLQLQQAGNYAYSIQKNS